METKFKNVIFDWSGVIKDSVKCHLWLVNKVFKEFGAEEISMEELMRNWVQPHMAFYSKYLPNVTQEQEAAVYKRAILSDECPKSYAYAGICELIKKLKDKGFFLSVISTDLPETVLPEIKHYGLENIFDEVTTEAHDKIISLKDTIEKFELNPEETYFVGDSNHEIIASKENGTKSVAVTWGYNTEEYLREKEPDYVAHNTKELENVLLK